MTSRTKVGAFVTTLFLALSLAGPSFAGWQWESNGNIKGSNDERFCADTLTISTRYSTSTGFIDAVFGTRPYAVGDPYPGPADILRLFNSSANATQSPPVSGNWAGVVATFNINNMKVSTVVPGSTLIYTGTQTVASGLADGTVVWARVQAGNPADPPTAVSFTIGAAAYNCTTTTTSTTTTTTTTTTVAPPTIHDLPFSISLHRDRVRIPVRGNQLVWFPIAGVDPSTVRIAANNGTPSPGFYLGSSRGNGFVVVDLRSAGVNCSTTQLILTASGPGGQFKGSRNVTPVGCGNGATENRED